MRSSQIVLLLAGVALAQPHRHHQHKRAIITATLWTTVQAADAMVYVDENGNPVAGPEATQAPQVQAVAAPSPPPVPAQPTPQAAPPAPVVQQVKPAINQPAPAPTTAHQAAPAPAPPAPAPPAAAPSVSVNTKNDAQDGATVDQGVPSSYGITWTGYKGTEDNSACKTYDDADAEWAQMGAFSTIRVYGTDCEQPANVLKLAKKYNKKVFMGVYDINDRFLPLQVGEIITAARANGGWGAVDTISIGNEDVNRGTASVGQVVAAVGAARVMLRAAGYRGPVVHVDTQNAILNNPTLCGHLAGDYIAANIHAYFDPNTSAEHAGDFVAGQVDALRQCGSNSWKRRAVRVRVTETGWPKAGEANGQAVPSKANQISAIASIKSKLSSDVFLFSAFNNYWMKNSPQTFGTEHFWGTLDN